MKNLKTLAILVIMLFITNETFAVRSVVVSRTKSGCLPGCNTADRTVNTVGITYANGRTEIVDQVTINCSGTGLSSCPSQLVRPVIDPVFTPAFDGTNASTEFDYALNAISLGTSSGNHSTNYTIASSNETWQFKVEWTTSLLGVEVITVYKELLSW